jgi:N-formylglutamate amidohydrolase
LKIAPPVPARHLPGILATYAPAPEARTLPLVFDSPHSGNAYPEDFTHVPSREILRRAEDAFVDELFGSAPDHGATFLKALFPRSYIDPNRDEHEIDLEMLSEPWPYRFEASEKAEMGLGLIRRLIKGNQEIYDRPLSVAEVEARILRCHRPYLAELTRLIEQARRTHGVAWHVNCHSMKSFGRDGPTGRTGDFVLGDREGTTCGVEFTDLVEHRLRDLGYRVAINDPFKGAALVARFGRPADASHSLQIEINRGLYMDEDRIEKSTGFSALKTDIGHLMASIAEFVWNRTSRQD